MLRFKSKLTIPFAPFAASMLTEILRSKYSVAENDTVSTEVAKKCTDELFAMMEEIVPGVSKA